jgi:hypothetical protein
MGDNVDNDDEGATRTRATATAQRAMTTIATVLRGTKSTMMAAV